MAGASSLQDERAGAEIVYGSEACYRQACNLFQELGFPKEVLPVEGVEELGRVRETGFVWMKRKAPFEYYCKGTQSYVSHATEITAYTEKFKMNKVNGVKGKEMMVWIPVIEMSINDPARKKIYFKTSLGIGYSYPLTGFMTEQEKKQFK